MLINGWMVLSSIDGGPLEPYWICERENIFESKGAAEEWAQLIFEGSLCDIEILPIRVTGRRVSAAE